jgi:hypothetical protein
MNLFIKCFYFNHSLYFTLLIKYSSLSVFVFSLKYQFHFRLFIFESLLNYNLINNFGFLNFPKHLCFFMLGVNFIDFINKINYSYFVFYVIDIRYFFLEPFLQIKFIVLRSYSSFNYLITS